MVEVDGKIAAVLYTQRIGFLEVNGGEVTGSSFFGGDMDQLLGGH